jgi:hypothetical protein
MKTKNLKSRLAAMVGAGLVLGACAALAQDSSALNTAPPAVAGTPVPQLAYGVPQILQLEQAKVSDDTIIAYIKNSGNSYGLNADQIIYLRQQGLSDAVITTMLNQPKPGVAAYTPATPAPPPVAPTAPAAPVPAPTAAPTVTYVQTVPATTYYYQPYYYPAYAVYPAVSLSFGWGGGWGGYYHGGYYGGWHGGGYGGWHGGGGYGGWHGGGWHH